ncbi:Ribosomal protein S24e [Carpediemonas membranifera]|uniref:Ribosomal protein S24e n=1 Tax=Carpediemonas membranifera TaxID=201153 RepID=A0A8J6DXD7_9EUKA|nr:Ribosomal protein S24e [Carpediemonas membranifera]|eukprot:KAG9389949.1 Ribosomal protein S24e [Carpediemonas membranifera]
MSFTVRTRKMMNNAVIGRRQAIVDIHHPGMANVSREEIKQKLVATFKIKDAECCILHGFRTQFGGNKSTGFCLIYNKREEMMKFEPKFRLVRAGLETKVESSRQQRHQRKNRAKKVRCTKKEAVLQGK